MGILVRAAASIIGSVASRHLGQYKRSYNRHTAGREIWFVMVREGVIDQVRSRRSCIGFR